ncbi:hypothetical protein HKD37_15G043946 [Glycine soja]
MMIDVGVHSVISLILAFILDHTAHHHRTMATPPTSSPPPLPLPPPPIDASVSLFTLKRTRKATQLRSLVTRPPGAKEFDMGGYSEFEIPEPSDSRTKKKILQTVGEHWRQHLQPTRMVWTTLSVKNMALARRNGPSFVRPAETPHGRMCGKRHKPSRSKTLPPTYCLVGLMAEKTKKRLEEAAQSGSTEGIIDPPSPIRRRVKWKMTRTRKTGQMTSKAAKEIANRIASQGSFVPHGHQDILTAAIGRPEHPGCARAAGAGVTIKQYFGSASRTSHSSSSMPPEDLQQLTQQIRDQLKESITEKGLALPLELEVGPSGPRVSTKESCVTPSGIDPGTGDSDKCGLYIEENLSRLVALGRLYEGSTTIHNIPLLHGQVKVGVEEVKDAEAFVPVPTDEVTLVGQTLNTFLAWPTHLAAVSSAKPPENPDEKVNDPLYLMTLTIPQLFLKPLQVMWDATIFGVFNQNFPLYIKHEDLSEIAHWWSMSQHICYTVVDSRGILMCMDSSSHSPFRDQGNHNLNPKVTSRVGYKVQNEMLTLEPT